MSNDEIVEDLDIPEAPPRPTNYIAFGRYLGEADMAALALPRQTEQRMITKIRSSHHSVARCLASGMKRQQVALVTGYTPERITQLERDPTFQALVKDYQTEANSIFADMASRMSDLSLDAIEILQERLHENPEMFTVPVLLDLVKALADRTGFGPNQDVNLRISADMIDRPPRESFEEWERRRARELSGPAAPTDKVTLTNEEKKLIN